MSKGGPVALLATSEALRRLSEGHRCYRESRMRETVEQFGRARAAAAAARAPGVEEEARFWEGAALHGLGRLEEALAVWGPSLRSDVDGPLTTARYMMITRYVLVAIDIPLPLSVIEAAVEQVAEATGGHGTGRRSRLLAARARLASLQGKFDDALALAQEALIRCRREHPAYTLSTHFRGVIRAALSAGKPELIERYLQEWEIEEHSYPTAKRLGLAAARSAYARYRNEPEQAMRHAEPVSAEAVLLEDLPASIDASAAYARACLAVGRPEAARPNIRHLMRHRRSAIGVLRFDAWLLLGDLHAACAVREVDGKGFDPEFGSPAVSRELRQILSGSEPVPHPSVPAGRARRHALQARRAYRAAGRIGAFIDDRLETRWHETRVAVRVRSAVDPPGRSG